MRRAVLLLCAMLLAALLFSVGAAAAPLTDDAGKPLPEGEVLYRQSFADVSDFAGSGCRIGTSSSEKCSVEVTDDMLSIASLDAGRAYVLLPSVRRGDSWTAEFTFRFSVSGSDNGSLAFLLTCRGDEPTNVTSLVIRGNGTVDGFPEPDEEIWKAIRQGLPVTVVIPVEDGAFHRLILKTEDHTCPLEMDSVKMIEKEGLGFSVRNTCVQISDVWIVNGTGYAEKSGGETSYATDALPGKEGAPEKPDPKPVGKPDPKPEKAPNTGDHFRDVSRSCGQVAIMSVGGAFAVSSGLFVRKARRR